jgi:NADH-quinone oxidoreductase subunit H
VVFVVKTFILLNVIVWIRWTLPRIRVDQMMNMCWKYLVPASFAAVLFVAVWMLIVHAVPAVGLVMRLVLTAAAAAGVVMFVLRVARNLRDTGDKFDFTSNW